MTKQERAAAVAQCLRDYLKAEDLRYREEKEGDDFKFFLSMRGETFSIAVTYHVDAEKQRILYSMIPYSPVKERSLELVMGINDINRKLSLGAFCVDKKFERFTYQYAHSYVGLTGFNPQFARDVIIMPFQVIDQYVDKLMRLNKGLVGLKEFSQSL